MVLDDVFPSSCHCCRCDYDDEVWPQKVGSVELKNGMTHAQRGLECRRSSIIHDTRYVVTYRVSPKPT